VENHESHNLFLNLKICWFQFQFFDISKCYHFWKYTFSCYFCFRITFSFLENHESHVPILASAVTYEISVSRAGVNRQHAARLTRGRLGEKIKKRGVTRDTMSRYTMSGFPDGPHKITFEPLPPLPLFYSKISILNFIPHSSADDKSANSSHNTFQTKNLSIPTSIFFKISKSCRVVFSYHDIFCFRITFSFWKNHGIP